MAWDVFPGLDMYCIDPAHHLITAAWGLDDLDRDLSRVLQGFVPRHPQVIHRYYGTAVCSTRPWKCLSIHSLFLYFLAPLFRCLNVPLFHFSIISTSTSALLGKWTQLGRAPVFHRDYAYYLLTPSPPPPPRWCLQTATHTFPALNVAEGCFFGGNPSRMFAEKPLRPYPHRWRWRSSVARLPPPRRRHRYDALNGHIVCTVLERIYDIHVTR